MQEKSSTNSLNIAATGKGGVGPAASSTLGVGERQLVLFPDDAPASSGPRIRTFDISRLSTYLDCRRRFRLRYVDDWDPKSLRNISAEYGSAVHAFMDAWHSIREWAPAWNHFREAWAALGGDSDKDQLRTEAHAEWFLRRYTQKYAAERFIILRTEAPFEIDVGPYILQGRIDKIVKAPGEAPQVMDHKTSSQLGYSTLLKYHPNLQMLGYVWVARQLLDPNIYTALVDIISTAKNVTKSIDDCFARRPVDFQDEEIDSFPRMFRQLADEINEVARRDVEGEGIDAWIPNFSQCTSYGECPFRRSVCTQPRELWQPVLEAEFEKKPWSPIREGEVVLRRGVVKGGV